MISKRGLCPCGWDAQTDEVWIQPFLTFIKTPEGASTGWLFDCPQCKQTLFVTCHVFKKNQLGNSRQHFTHAEVTSNLFGWEVCGSFQWNAETTATEIFGTLSTLEEALKFCAALELPAKVFDIEDKDPL